MFQQVAKYSVQMTNILFSLSDIEIMNKQIIEEKDKIVQHLFGALENEQKFKAKLQIKNSENNHVLAKLQVVKQKINNMEKQSKYLENIITERDSLHATLKQIDANYWGFKVKKDTLSIEHNRLKKITRTWRKLS